MTLQDRIRSLVNIGQYIQSDNESWLAAKQFAEHKNGWFTQPFIDLAANNIAQYFLQENILTAFASQYQLSETPTGKKVGITMAGNIPLVGFHDFMCTFLAGHTQAIKLSEKDEILLKHLVEAHPEMKPFVQFEIMLKGCDAYIATGSNNSARYFEQYFAKYPHIIRKNRTSVALLDGTESKADLLALADDVYVFFGLGCRNVTKIYVPENYDFVPLLNAFNIYKKFAEHNKYKNNYDYNLAIHILNKVYYMTNETILLVEDERFFSPISQLHYSFYNTENKAQLLAELQQINDIQCVVGTKQIPFGAAQQPDINQYADGVDTMKFLQQL